MPTLPHDLHSRNDRPIELREDHPTSWPLERLLAWITMTTRGELQPALHELCDVMVALQQAHLEAPEPDGRAVATAVRTLVVAEMAKQCDVVPFDDFSDVHSVLKSRLTTIRVGNVQDRDETAHETLDVIDRRTPASEVPTLLARLVSTARLNGEAPADDPCVRLIAHRLAWVFNVEEPAGLAELVPRHLALCDAKRAQLAMEHALSSHRPSNAP